MEQVKGVNLGGWLVLERWISPSVFSGTKARDEYSLCSELGAKAAGRLKIHRDNFITEDHIKELSRQGLNTLRLPVGYWLFGSESPFVDGADAYVDRVFSWVDKYDFKVILDFHAAPGSQNGNDHSGQAGEINWSEPDNVLKSLEFIDKLTRRYGKEEGLVGVEVLNEPDWGIGLPTLIDYYAKADEIVKSNCHPGVSTIVHDAFRPKEMALALDAAGLDVVLDVHLYQLFTPEDRTLNLKGHIRKTKRDWKKLLKKLGRSRQLLVGEWSVAMHELYRKIDQPDCHYTPGDYRKYFLAQCQVFEKTKAGWTYWTARTEDGGIWSYIDQDFEV
ncbi:MAG TPA: cellulase family glycosylhydrolase [Candidatus Saccharimonadales bacterium]|nr:cellulase family glycosylhydrolase [Candidatus Saccharimonadales bacterium]